MEANPYAPPQADITPDAPVIATSIEQTRNDHLATEAHIRSAGTLFYLGALAWGLMGLAGLGVNELRFSLLIWSGSLLSGFLAHGLRQLHSWARIPAIILFSIGLLGFPLITLLSADMLRYIGSKKGKFVMSPAYHEIITQTPHLKYKKSSQTAIALLFVLVAILFLLGAYAWMSFSE